MVERYLLEGLVAFAKYGTLAKAAESLAVTQPALTGAMKKLEAELDVRLFKRQPNRITLTETGEYAVKEAQKLLWTDKAFTIKVQNFAQNHSLVNIGADAPGPLIIVRAVNRDNINIHSGFIKDDFEAILSSRQLSMLLLNHPLADTAFDSIYLGTEALSVNVTKDSPLAGKTAISFKDLAGTTFLVALNVGFWGQIFEKMIPQAKLIYQSKTDEYSELLQNSTLPFFTTNLTPLDTVWGSELPKDRQQIPITDQIAHQKFYACFLKENATQLKPIVRSLQDKWRTVDPLVK